MMLTKPVGQWQTTHAHLPRRGPGKMEGWPVSRIHAGECEQLRNQGIGEYSEATERLLINAMARCPNISMNTRIMQGQPCILGTRIPVRSVLRAIEQYGSVDAVKGCYPHLTIEQVEEALYFSQIILELPRGRNEATSVAR